MRLNILKLVLASKIGQYLFLLQINMSIQHKCIQLIKSDSKDIYMLKKTFKYNLTLYSSKNLEKYVLWFQQKYKVPQLFSILIIMRNVQRITILD